MEMSLSFRRLLCLGLLVVSAAASAQALTLSFPSGAERMVVGSSACSTQFSISWTFSAGFQACRQLQVWASTTSCTKDGPVGDDELLFQTTVLSSSGSGTFSSPLGAWPRFKGEGAVACGAEDERGIVREHNICGLVFISNTFDGKCDRDLLSKTLVVAYRTIPPSPPQPEGELEGDIVRVRGYDGQATIRFSTSGSDLDEVQLFKLESDGERQERGKVKVSAGNFLSISELQDGIPSRFVLRAVDLAGNSSGDSKEIEVLSTRTDGFWDLYKQSGGKGGGCHSAGQGSLGALALVFFGLGIARRRQLC